MGSVMDLLANYDPNRLVYAKQNQQAGLARAGAETQNIQAEAATRQQQNQLVQRQMQDSDILMRAYANTSGDPKDVGDYLRRNGISGPGFMGWQQHDIDLRTKAANMTKVQRENAEAYHNQAGDVIDAVNAAAPEQQAAMYQYQLPKLKSLAPDVQWPQQYDSSTGKLLSGVLGHATKVMEQAKVLAETKKAGAETEAAQEKTGVEKRTQALQDLSGVTDADSFSQWQQRNPDLAKELPSVYTPAAIAFKVRSIVPAEKQPEYTIQGIQAAAMTNAKPGDWDALVDKAIDPSKSDLYAKENQTTKALVQGAVEKGVPPDKVMAFIKDGADRIGRFESGVAQAKATAPIKVQVAAQTEAAKNAQGALSPEAIDMAAELYRKTGQMPQMGMGNKIARQQIMNRAAAMGPVDLATEGAAFQANKSSLVGLTKQRDAVAAFENTAGKNLDLFLQQAKNAVDTGSAWINSPLRTVAKGMLGSADQAAYDTARQVAINEIAKVTSNPGLSGQLSDTARKEVGDFNPNSATLAQTYRVAQILKQDMANRHESYNEQIGDIQKRIGVGGSANAAPAETNTRGQVKVTAPDGSVHTFADQASADKFKKLAKIP